MHGSAAAVGPYKGVRGLYDLEEANDAKEHPMTRDRRQGFTIVEMLIIIAIITLLMGLLVPALGGVRHRAHKMEEIHALRQVAYAWNMYANSNNDYALPGYVDPDVQADWTARYQFMDRSVIPPAIAAPWTWRLMPYLDYNHEMVHGHLDEPEFDMISMTANQIAADADLFDEAVELAERPSFGYNGYYVGGWWDERVEIPPSEPGGEPDVIWRYRFWDAKPGGATPLDPSISVVARSPGTIRDPSNLIIFCSSAQVPPGLYRKWLEETPGWHLVTPPILANQQQWMSGRTGAQAGDVGALILGQVQVGTGLDDGTLEAVASPLASVPIGRYTGKVAAVYADLHCTTESPGKLSDQRKWIYSADTKDFTHSP